jgi:transposase
MERGGLIANYRGKLVHDGLGAYKLFPNCEHYYCNAHLLRELVYLHEEMDQAWAGEMIELLTEAKKLADREAARPEGSRRVIGEQSIRRIMGKYSDTIIRGYAANPEPPPPPPGKRDRPKRGKALNLLDRLDKKSPQIMGFFAEENIPYDNNQAERDLRMMKVHDKVSGTFRNEDYGEAFCEVRSIISSVRKQSGAMLESLGNLLTAPETLGKDLASGQTT